jgi:hypothetical protein
VDERPGSRSHAPQPERSPKPRVTTSETSRAEPPFWNPRTGIFDPAQLRLAIVMRGWTVAEFAKVARIGRASLYHALLGAGVADRTAIRIFQTLATREPFSLTLS